MSNKEWPHVVISRETFNKLRKLGKASESIHDVIKRLLEDREKR
jgi:predicted CopG family antitoxin